ncbi:MAG: hypothetical protein ACWM02_01200, partial [Brevibacterium paucivorans]
KDAPSAGRAIANKILPSFPTCPIPDIKRLAQTPNQWRNEYLGYADIDSGRAGRGLLDRVQRDPAS